MRLFSVIIFLGLCSNLFAQTTTEQRMASFEKKKVESSFVNGIPFRNIGPTIMSGRITDVEVNPNNTNEFYVAYASGGVWYSANNGQSFSPVFDKEASITIGDMAVNWQKNIIWVGTGEVNSSRSSYAGTGIYTSDDSGKTWLHKGLMESHHVGKIVLHPNNANIAWVAVLGHLYTKNNERGIYKTIDGGKTWQQSLFVNDSSGCADLAIDPNNAQILYTSSWTRTRTAWQFNGSGEGSAIYKSIDGGEHWKKISGDQSGFPSGKGVGRIGISVFPKQSNILYAVVDNNFNQDKIKEEDKDKLKPRDIEAMSTATFLALDNKKLESYLRDNEYPKQYSAESVKQDVRDKKYTVKTIAEWRLADADASLFDTPVYGAQLYCSKDGGLTWKKTHDDVLEGVFFTYGYYFATIAVSPKNENKILIAGYPLVMSEDGGKTFTQIDGDNCHPDYHRIWIDPNNDNHMIACNDGGLNITYDAGKSWFKANNPAVGQFYAIAVDNAKPYNVYGGLQDNGTWYGPSSNVENNAWLQNGEYAYKSIGGGDGMQVQVDSRNDQVYVGYQFGNYMRIDKKTFDVATVKPIYLIGEKPLRFNWQTPIVLSKHNEDILYMGSNYFHRSLKKGEGLEKLSADLTTTKNKGNVPYGTITTISESPLRFGLIYVGTDDGHLHVSKDVGYTWTKISNPLPQHKWVTRVIASKHKLERVYVTLNAYRNDDFKAYVFVSNDYGKTWQDIGSSLPQEPINVLREDPINEYIIYVGSDNGLYVSYNAGKDFMYWQSNLPRVAIHDIAIQERENDIVLGTHGRSIYIANLAQIQSYPNIRDKGIYVSNIDTVAYNENLGKRYAVYTKPESQKINIHYFTQSSGACTIKILSDNGKTLFQDHQEAILGFNTYEYDLSFAEKYMPALKNKSTKSDDGKFYLPKGKYAVEITNASNQKYTSPLIIK